MYKIRFCLRWWKSNISHSGWVTKRGGLEAMVCPAVASHRAPKKELVTVSRVQTCQTGRELQLISTRKDQSGENIKLPPKVQSA